MSYSWKAQSSLSSILPRLVMLRAQMNSLKSMLPDLSLSKTLKTYSAKEVGSPKGKNWR